MASLSSHFGWYRVLDLPGVVVEIRVGNESKYHQQVD
jgi:hypothetical protein